MSQNEYDAQIQLLKESEARLKAENKQLRQTFIEALSNVLMARSPVLLERGRRMSQYAVETARQLGLSTEDIEMVRLAGLFYDYGAISVPEAILNKPARLTDDELEVMRQSILTGAKIFSNVYQMETVSAIIASQNEWYAGTYGFPGQQQGEAIPLGARIIAVCKAYDALTASRFYRVSVSGAEALVFITKQAGTQFDPKVVAAFKASLG